MIHIEMTFKNSSCIKKQTYKLFNVGIICLFDDTLTYQIVKNKQKIQIA